VETPTPCLVDKLEKDNVSKLQVHLAPGSQSVFPLLCCAEDPPTSMTVDGQNVPVSILKEGVSVTQLSLIIQGLIDKTKIQVVAAKGNCTSMSKVIAHLDVLITALEHLSTSKRGLVLGGLSSMDRVRQYRETKAICQGGRTLRNQVIDIANFSSVCGSEEAASFLNGREMKFANKALRRAAKLSSEGVVVDPKRECRNLLKELSDKNFQQALISSVFKDTITNIVRLSSQDFKNKFLPFVRASNNTHGLLALEIREKTRKVDLDGNVEESSLGLSASATSLIISGELLQYLNDMYHGKRKSYLSLSSPCQHVMEWVQFADQQFDSVWEMLMFSGLIGYPIVLERSPASQMNPFLLAVRDVRFSIADTASICCANQASVPLYGPEGGEAVEDVLVLVDPSMPRSSKMIFDSLLLEKYTSVVVARDLHMYSGVSMQVALHANCVFHVVAVPDQIIREDVIADLQRKYMGRAFQCAGCGFGPIDHFGCSDLEAHHGEQAYNGDCAVDNSCPKCQWFSSDIDDWDKWNGEVCEEYIKSEIDNSEKADAKQRHSLSEVKIELLLRILYSLKKILPASQIMMLETLADEMSANRNPDFSEKAGVEGISQLFLALVIPLMMAENAENAFPTDFHQSKDCLLSIIRESCAREARTKFRKQSSGDKEMASKLAIKHVTKLLGIDPSTAPEALPQMEAEPPLENVRADCDDSFNELNTEARNTLWVRNVAKEWCRAWSFASAFCEIVSSRPGGWRGVERDMETGTSHYQDVVEALKRVELETPRQFFEMDREEMQSLFLRIGVQAILKGACGISVGDPVNLLQDDSVLHNAAREMRMLIYLNRIREKMAQWKIVGEQAIFMKARVADIAQFSDMIHAKPHIHGFDKQTFWGLWLAAKNSKCRDKVDAFLQAANDEFKDKHGIPLASLE